MSKKLLYVVLSIIIIALLTAPWEELPYSRALTVNEASELLKKTGKFQGTYHYVDKKYNGIYGKGQWYYEFRIRGENDSYYTFYVYTQTRDIYLIGETAGTKKLPKPTG